MNGKVGSTGVAMARARNIKPGFFKNEYLASMQPLTRLLFIGIWTLADREGRMEYRPKRIWMELFSLEDSYSVEDGIAELAEAGFLTIYDVGGKTYIQVSNWSKHQNPHHKEVGSEIPAPAGHTDTVCKGYIPLSNTIRRRIYERDGRVCKQCGAEHGLSIDHIIPVSRGGNSVDDNLQVLCVVCNARKSNKLHTSIMHESGMLHAFVNNDASCTTDSLIPDSLIPSITNPNGLVVMTDGHDASQDEKEVSERATDEAQPATPLRRKAQEPCPTRAIIDLYHRVLPELKEVRVLSANNARHVRQLWRTHLKSLDEWERFFGFIRKSDFLMGRISSAGRAPFVPTLIWLVKPENFANIANRKYHP